MANSQFFLNRKGNSKTKFHTPSTFRSQRQLRFPPPSTTSFSATPPALTPPGVDPPNASENTQRTPVSTIPPNVPTQYILPWETPGSTATSLYKTSPPKLQYPAGSRDKKVINRFLKKMDMFLFKCYQVRAVLVGTRPHPFLSYDRLNRYWIENGKPAWKFDKSKTFEMLAAV